MRITVTGVGAAASLLVILVFSAYWILKIRKRDGTVLSAGEIMNAAGFGLLPGLAVWKIFEQRTPLGTGAAGFDPLRDLPVLTRNGRFAVSGTEVFLAVLCFAAAVIWLIFRKEELPGNGDLLLTVVCVWGLTRAFTEGFRETTLFSAGSVNVTQILLLAAADIPMAVWTVRLEAAQKNTASAVLEWIALLSCEAVMVLNTAGVLSSGSDIGDAAVNAGCAVLCILLSLSAGKDSRK